MSSTVHEIDVPPLNLPGVQNAPSSVPSIASPPVQPTRPGSTVVSNSGITWRNWASSAGSTARWAAVQTGHVLGEMLGEQLGAAVGTPRIGSHVGGVLGESLAEAALGTASVRLGGLLPSRANASSHSTCSSSPGTWYRSDASGTASSFNTPVGSAYPQLSPVGTPDFVTPPSTPSSRSSLLASNRL